MNPLPTELRNKLERTIIAARDVAEAGAKAALEALAVHHHEPYGHMSPEERKLRNHLRARARQLGDKQNRKGELEITHLIWECAYEHWHRMLFARFLAENELLIEPEIGVAISLEECEELAKEDGKDLWTLASEFAQQMLPQIFRLDDPILRVTFASEHRLKLEKLLNDLEPSIFTASDSLGWVYQFWQSKRKKEVNESGNKIGTDELPAVTQLFTESYMVSFLLDNSLGAWWAARRLSEADLKTATGEEELRCKATIPGVPLNYLRFVQQEDDTWTPAAGTFAGWPECLSEFKTLDPCCGSGHFIVAAFLMLVPMRMELEGLTAREAVDRVLSENIHGLELDQRCVELAAFALALTAWKCRDAGGYRLLPELNVACSGLAISAKKEEWLALARDNINLRMALAELYKQFKDAPVLGSLINPEAGLGKGSLFALKWEDVGPLLNKALAVEKDDETTEMRVVAKGLSIAATLLTCKYDLLLTNVPYLATRRQSKNIVSFLEDNYFRERFDLAIAFISRCVTLSKSSGTVCHVSPQAWHYLGSYKAFRASLLESNSINAVARLGAGAFETISGEVVNVCLSIHTSGKQHDKYYAIDVSQFALPGKKALSLQTEKGSVLKQSASYEHPDKNILMSELEDMPLLQDSSKALAGILNGDANRFRFRFWEVIEIGKRKWALLQENCGVTAAYSGRSAVLLWENEEGQLHKFAEEAKERLHDAHRRGNEAWNKNGVALSRMGTINATIYTGNLFDQNVAVILPNDEHDLLTIWCFCSSDEYGGALKKINPSLAISSATVAKVGFDKSYWQKIVEEKYPSGLPKPYSEDPTQWIFHGHPCGSVLWDEESKWTTHGAARTDETVLQIAVARLLGYRWPAELDAKMELADEQREWVNKCDDLLKYVDGDGIACIPSVRGEDAAAGRLRRVLSVVFGSDWSPSTEQELIHTTGINTANLDDWLRDHFFAQHCKLFHHRPFIWHIWDGRRRDGFHALVNYHKLAEGNGKGRQLLENLTYSYLGDWITRQREGVKRGEGGAEDRLVAAFELQKRLIAIIEGEPPFDIFVRWKPVEKQPIGWEPDINDGVRLNIRPFMASDIPGGRKGTGILRWKPNIKWGKDRGKEPSRPQDQYPWFWENGEFTGDRVNDIHLSINDKQKARKEKKQT